MLNTFPTLLSFALFVPFIFRISIALFLLELAISLKNKKSFTAHLSANRYPGSKIIPYIFQIGIALSAIFILIGLFTQISSLVALYFFIVLGNINKHIKLVKHSESTFTYASLICFSLLFLGAGVFAFDLPL